VPLVCPSDLFPNHSNYRPNRLGLCSFLYSGSIDLTKQPDSESIKQFKTLRLMLAIVYSCLLTERLPIYSPPSLPGTSFCFFPGGWGQNVERLPRGGQNVKKKIVCKNTKNHYFSNSMGANAPPAPPQMSSLISPP